MLKKEIYSSVLDWCCIRYSHLLGTVCRRRHVRWLWPSEPHPACREGRVRGFLIWLVLARQISHRPGQLSPHGCVHLGVRPFHRKLSTSIKLQGV